MKNFRKSNIYFLVFLLISVKAFAQSEGFNQRQIQSIQETCDADIPHHVIVSSSWVKHDHEITNCANSGKARGVLWDNGGFITHPGAGSNGSDYSMAQDVSLGLETYGLGFRRGNQHINNSIADDFEVTDTWLVSTITFYGYQSYYGPPTTLREVTYRIYDGDPSQGGAVIYGDLGENKLVSSQWINAWRVLESEIAETRPIMELVADATGLVLSPGTYWIEWQASGSGTSGPFTPPVTSLGTVATGNAMKWNILFGWTPALDYGEDHHLDIHFLINGVSGTLATNDLTLATIVSPASGYGLGEEQVTVKIYNYGTNDQSGFDVSFTINGGSAITETVAETVPANGSLEYTFSTTVDLSVVDEYSIEACVLLSGDEAPENDCVEKSVSNYHGATVYPQMADYWTGSTNGTVKTESSLSHAIATQESGWMKFDISSIPVGATIQKITFYTYVYYTSWPYWSITPLFREPVSASAADLWEDIEAGSSIEEAYAFNDESVSYAMGWHEYTLDISAINDLTAALPQGWFALGAFDRIFNPGFPVKMEGWNEENIPYLIVLYEDPTNIDEKQPSSHVSIFPNPATDIVNVQSDINIENITTYNLTGQEMESVQINNIQTRIDLSGYDPGIYFMRIRTEGKTISKRMVIQ